MDNAGSTSADVESWTLVNYLEEGGFPALLWDTLKDFGYTTDPECSIRKNKAKIQELSEIIHEQNFLLQHNHQYMLELENQLEAIAAPPPEPIIPGPEGGGDVEEVEGESRVESGPESP
jgi:hypothetical protein